MVSCCRREELNPIAGNDKILLTVDTPSAACRPSPWHHLDDDAGQHWLAQHRRQRWARWSPGAADRRALHRRRYRLAARSSASTLAAGVDVLKHAVRGHRRQRRRPLRQLRRAGSFAARAASRQQPVLDDATFSFYNNGVVSTGHAGHACASAATARPSASAAPPSGRHRHRCIALRHAATTGRWSPAADAHRHRHHRLEQVHRRQQPAGLRQALADRPGADQRAPSSSRRSAAREYAIFEFDNALYSDRVAAGIDQNTAHRPGARRAADRLPGQRHLQHRRDLPRRRAAARWRTCASPSTASCRPARPATFNISTNNVLTGDQLNTLASLNRFPQFGVFNGRKNVEMTIYLRGTDTRRYDQPEHQRHA